MRSSGFRAETACTICSVDWRLSALGAVRRADGAVNHPQVVVYFGNRAYGRTGGPRGGFLFDGDRRRKPFDRIDVRPFHLVKKLSGVGREGFDVAALPLGVKSIEGKRGFARPGEPRDHCERIARDFQVDVF